MNAQTLKKAKTFNGFTLEQVLEELQKRLSEDAYDQVPHASYLTSTNAGHTLERLTQIFGPFGVGFGLNWQPEHLSVFPETRVNKNKEEYIMWVAGLDQATFWFLLTDGEELEYIKFPVTGGSDNKDRGYAIRGARTNALGDGAKQMLYQLPLYKEKGDNPPQSTGAPIEDPGSVTVPFDKAKELFGGTAPTIADLYDEDAGLVEWICRKIDGKVGDAARQYIAQLAGDGPITQLSGGGKVNNMAALMAYAEKQGHKFAHAGKLLEHLGWNVAPRPDETAKWNQAVAALTKEGDAAPEPFPEATGATS